jgi:hypothetical protein
MIGFFYREGAPLDLQGKMEPAHVMLYVGNRRAVGTNNGGWDVVGAPSRDIFGLAEIDLSTHSKPFTEGYYWSRASSLPR